MTPLQLYYFIGKCLVMDEDPGANQWVEAELRSGRVPWEQLVWQGSNHFVLPALYSAFHRHSLLPWIPPDLAEHLLNIYELNLRRNRDILEQVKDLIRVLNIHGIEPIFIKGAAHLLENLYHDPRDRIMSDIDILVRGPEIANAAGLLLENGYSQPGDPEKNNLEDHHHLPAFEHARYPARVELHRLVLPEKYIKILPPWEMDAEKRKLPGLDAWVLSPRHQLVLNFVHSQLVGQEFMYRSISMKGLYDFYLLAKKHSPAPLIPLSRKYPHQYNAYCTLLKATFNNTRALDGLKTNARPSFLKRYEYLMNHPGLGAFYQLLVLYLQRIKKILSLYSTAPFSSQSRQYIRMKTGSSEARKEYFQKLKKEIIN